MTRVSFQHFLFMLLFLLPSSLTFRFISLFLSFSLLLLLLPLFCCFFFLLNLLLLSSSSFLKAMEPSKLHLLFLFFISHSAFHIIPTAAIGVNYGTVANNLPPPFQVATFLKTKTTIDRVKIFDTNPDVLHALANTGIAVTVTVGNADFPPPSVPPRLGSLPTSSCFIRTPKSTEREKK